MVLRNLVAWLWCSSRPQSPVADGYITIIYPERTNGIVVHDSLSEPDGISISPIEVNELNVEESWAPEESFDDYVMARMEPTSLINPATGLLMLNEHIDVGGNFFGFGDD